MVPCTEYVTAWCLWAQMNTEATDRGLLAQRFSPDMLKAWLTVANPSACAFSYHAWDELQDHSSCRLSLRMARRFLVFPEKGSLQRGEWVKANCWLQHVRPISYNSGTTGVDAGIPSKCNQTPPVARRCVIQWGSGGACESELPSVTLSDGCCEERESRGGDSLRWQINF